MDGKGTGRERASIRGALAHLKWKGKKQRERLELEESRREEQRSKEKKSTFNNKETISVVLRDKQRYWFRSERGVQIVSIFKRMQKEGMKMALA